MIYGESDLGIEYAFVAVRPFTAEHPIGSGKIVSYSPGDQFPGGDWGNAANVLVEVGKAVRLATNIVVGGSSQVAAPPPPSEPEPDPEIRPGHTVSVYGEDVTYPLRGGGGWWTLSDGNRVRGEDEARAAESALGEGE